MKCIYCGMKMEWGTTTLTLNVLKEPIPITDIPCLICTCGEVYLPLKIQAQIGRFAEVALSVEEEEESEEMATMTI
ncbi:MAG: hypothetical protein HY730_04890 [Candidatus Tectomicrobia bacterium]|uniref:YgiT-type zinc finger protein n=1 Tax=Tectimicrobiota bacterium TaxID=2528274 RepID=A0A933GNC2_UNCTE|nr:hypothetical protein [Candidatus Tectomicrobia bacterium]